MAILGICLWALNITHDVAFLTDQSFHCCFERSQKETIRKRTGQELSARKRSYASYKGADTGSQKPSRVFQQEVKPYQAMYFPPLLPPVQCKYCVEHVGRGPSFQSHPPGTASGLLFKT